MRKRIVLSAGAILLSPLLAFGQLFGGGLVVDVLQEANSGRQVINDIQKIQQLTQTYRQITAQYNQMIYMATSFGNKSGWLGVMTPMVNSNTLAGINSATAGWNGAANQGLNIPGAYSNATYAMTPPAFYSAYPIGTNLPSAIMASVAIADGSNPAALMAVSQARQNQPQNELAIQHLEATSQDTSAGTNSEIDQLNLANGGLVLLNRQLETSNSLTAAQAEQQLLMNKIQRDNLADAINFNGQMDLTTAGQALTWGGSASTITAW